MLKVWVFDIEWDADEGIDLPNDVVLELNVERPKLEEDDMMFWTTQLEIMMMDRLAEDYGFCVEGLAYEIIGGLNDE